MDQTDLDRVLHQELVKIINHILDNPAMNRIDRYDVGEILNLKEMNFQLHSQHIFGIMSSALSLGKKEQDKFIEKYPETQVFSDKFGPNRVQYAMNMFAFFRKFDPMVIQIMREKILKSLTDNQEYSKLFDLYGNLSDIRYKIALYKVSPKFLKAKIILLDQDPRIQRLRFDNSD